MTKVLKPLIMMQLKDKLDMGWLRSKKQAITKIILSILAFALITGVVFALLFISKLMKIFHLMDIVPISVMVVVFTVMEILSLITCTFGVMKTLYFSKDNSVLLTLPVTTNQVFLSKLIVYFIYELKKTLFFIVPIFIAYGIVSGYPLYFFLWLIACWLLIAILNISFAGLFSIVAMLITMFLRNFNIIRIILFTVVVGLAIWGVVSLINLIPENLDIIATWGKLFWEIQHFLNAFMEKFLPFTYLTQMVLGKYFGLKVIVFNFTTFKIVGVLLLVIFVLLGLSFLVSRPLFFKMAAKPFEYRKVTREFKRQNRKTNAFVSAVKTQALLIIRTSEDLFSLMGCAIALPIMTLLLNKLFAAMSTRLFGDYMTVAFNMLIILLIALASNGKIASIYSREGSAAYLNKTRPNEYRTNLVGKLIPNTIVMTVSIITSVSIFANFSSLSIFNSICFALSVLFIYWMHLLWSAEMDIMNPQSNQYATTGEHANNPNETKSSVMMFVVSALIVAWAFFLSMESIKVAWIKVMFLCLALFGYRIWSFLSKIKYYYKGK